jgi:hypothetical protein
MEAVHSSEILTTTYLAAWCYNPEYNDPGLKSFASARDVILPHIYQDVSRCMAHNTIISALTVSSDRYFEVDIASLGYLNLTAKANGEEVAWLIKLPSYTSSP